MPLWGNREPEYRRRARKEAEKDKQESQNKRRQAAERAYVKKIIAAINAIGKQLQGDSNENRPRKKWDRFWEITGVAGLWLAACVGVAAIWVGNSDSAKQRTIMQNEVGEMLAQQRAWVKIEKIAPMDSLVDPRLGGLAFVKPNTIGFLPLYIVLKNVGHSPAFDVRVGIRPFFGYAEKIDNLAEEEQKNCSGLDTAFVPTPIVADNSTFVRVIFPGDEVPYDSVALALLPDKVNKYSIGDPVKVFQLWFYGCIRYRLADSEEPHQTSFAYRVSHLVEAPAIPGGKAMDVSFIPWESIPADKILIQARPMAAGVTN